MTAKILNITLALAIFLSSSGLIISKHYCKNELQGVALFFHAKSCHQKNKPTPCTAKAKTRSCCQIPEEPNDCCDNEQEYVKLDQDQQIQSFEFERLKNPVLLSTIFVVLNIELPSLDTHTLNYLTYKPPIVCDDISLLLQTFLL